ncbi:phytanoyl-CoA dioxygenase family protein [Rhizorhabdus histidinilytica]|jgi:ectoine hydroxylase-related dioxygenase (phytanoyl-CoA dioxygenase family)|uniref:Ectoine hydroxylase-related dioxygenase, phytanoyl-CoA dioxygenase (PhyH) family n=2 Tax=Rhizorhabdus histidinilytica TaxID=439228 RepID=A0A1T5EIC7_9SPHN|nr:phytanoyl-CoA dioxygenase family protein [Rhizorhabdus histidinilytica]SKB83684.1 Ectoine hydroxylase-related dioxygenase, phytanoyl-CoA dioxygenase (PhyH) family [Rhizorhabdus histidinilytica]
MIQDSDIIEQFDRDGAAVLRQAVSADWVEKLRAAAEEAFAHPSQFGRSHTPEGAAGGEFRVDRFIWLDHPVFRDFVLEGGLAALAAKVLGSERINFFYDHLFVKEPGSVEATPWHNDLPYWPIRGSQICSFWLALDQVSERSGGLRYVRGSHKWNTLFQPVAASDKDRHEWEGSTFQPLPDIDGNPDAYELLSWDLEPGDILIHHGLTVHGAFGNSTVDRRRRGLATRWTGDDVIYDPRPGTMGLPVDPGLVAGQPLDSALFPRMIGPAPVAG